MAPSTQADLLEPINFSPSISTRSSSISGRSAQIAGISKMQLDYWTNKAQIRPRDASNGSTTWTQVETVMLIKQAKDKGLNLEAAIEAARAAFAERERPEAVSTAVSSV